MCVRSERACVSKREREIERERNSEIDRKTGRE